MNSAIFIPQTIKVGFNNRQDTYTGKLAYVIYYDAKNKLRKEKSWDSWRDKKIDSEDFSNAPISGFVLNKKVGGTRYEWNPRQTYTRVFDPRGFEFEITVPNLLYILENTNSIKGKGLEGDFIYGWDGTELLLIPVEAPEYVQLTNYSDMVTNPEVLGHNNMIPGATYKTNKNENWIFLGRFNYYGRAKVEKHYFFQQGTSYHVIKSMGGKIVKCEIPEPVDNYAELMEELEHHTIYSPVDRTKTEYVEYTLTELEKISTLKRYNQQNIHLTYYGNKYAVRIEGDKITYDYYDPLYREYEYQQMLRQFDSNRITKKPSLEKLHQAYHFSKRLVYLENGKLKHPEDGRE